MCIVSLVSNATLQKDDWFLLLSTAQSGSVTPNPS